MGNQIRLDKYISNAGFGSRKDVRSKIQGGRVLVNSAVISDCGHHVSSDDIITVDGRPVDNHSYHYYMLNKPSGCVSATEDTSEKTVMDLFPADRPKGLAPVGRLDKDTVGLLLITNDGELAHRLISPKHDIAKVYYVKTAEPITSDDIEAFKSGIILKDGTKLMPADLSIYADDEQTASVTIREGKYHQIKRMFASRGNKVIYLKRLSFGSLSLDPDLPEGSYRKLTDQEISDLRDSTFSPDPV